MKQSFQFKKDEFSRLTKKLIGISHPSFLNSKSIEETLANCLVAIEGEDSVEIGEIIFMGNEKIVTNGLGPITDIHFTLSKMESTDKSVFLAIIAKFNS